MNKGWIIIFRKLQDCFIWQDKPFAKGQAWIDMLLLANHAEKRFMSKNEIVDVDRGSFLVSDQILADRWGWGRKKVRLFLTLLENELMIETKRNSKGTIVTVLNYDVYQTLQQDEGTSKEHQKNIKGTTEEHQRNTNNECKNNVNKDILKDVCRFTPPTLEEVTKYCIERNNKVDPQKFIDFYTSKGWMVGKNKMKSWQASVRTWEKEDKDIKTTQPKQSTNKFCNFEQRQYSADKFKEIERAKLSRRI